MCASGRYNESQMTASGSPTSLVVPLPHPHQSEVAYRLNFDMEEKLFPAIVSRRSPAAHCPCLGNGLGSGLYLLDSSPSAASSMSRARRGRCLCMSRFSLDFRESKRRFLSPNSFSTMAEITPTTSLVVEIPETSENPTHYSP